MHRLPLLQDDRVQPLQPEGGDVIRRVYPRDHGASTDRRSGTSWAERIDRRDLQCRRQPEVVGGVEGRVSRRRPIEDDTALDDPNARAHEDVVQGPTPDVTGEDREEPAKTGSD